MAGDGRAGRMTVSVARTGLSGCEAGQRGLQAALKDRQVDAAGKVAQLDKRAGGPATLPWR